MKHVLTRTRFLVREVDERRHDQDLTLMSVSVSRGVVPRSYLTDDDPRAEDLSNYKICQPGDIVVNRMSAYQGALGMASERGIVSPDYLVLRPSGAASPRWLHYLMRSSWFVSEMSARIRGIGSIGTGNVRTPRVSSEEIGQIRVAVPELAVQHATVSFLDSEAHRLDKAALDIRSRVELLAQRRRRLLDNFFEPAGSATRLKRLLRQPPCYGVLVPQLVDDGVPFVRVGDVPGVERGTLPSGRIAESQSLEYGRTVLAAGDIVLSVVGSIDKVAVVPPELAGANTARAVARLCPATGVSSWLLARWFETNHYLDQARLGTLSDTAQPTLNMGDLSNFEVSWSPGLLDRQERLRKELKRHDDLIDASRRQADLLAERKQALITAAVTGQLDLARDIAGEAS